MTNDERILQTKQDANLRYSKMIAAKEHSVARRSRNQKVGRVCPSAPARWLTEAVPPKGTVFLGCTVSRLARDGEPYLAVAALQRWVG